MFENKCKGLRDELKIARDEAERLNGFMAEMTTLSRLDAAVKVCHIYSIM